MHVLAPHDWLRPEDKVAILAHGRWSPRSSAKTGIQVIRYSRARTIAVVDPACQGQDAAKIVGLPAKAPVPVRATLDEVIARDGTPTRVLVGIAPPGGALPTTMREDIKRAIARKIPVLAGLHVFLADDPEFRALAEAHGTPLVDLRRPPDDPRVADGSGRFVPVPVVLTVGTDCSAGKMTVAVALREAGTKMGLRVAFVATGQTGLLLEPDAGAPIDRVISDFAAGETERQVLAAARLDETGAPTAHTPDLIVVEGQGAVTHPSYGGVSLALLQGSWPDALIMCHPAGRRARTVTTTGPPFAPHAIADEIRIVEAIASFATGARVAAVCTADFTDAPDTYGALQAQAAEETNLPVFDVLRDGAEGLLEVLLRHLVQHRSQKRIPVRRSLA